MSLTTHARKMMIGAAAFTALFYVARRGFIGADAQSYATELANAPLIDGVKF